MVRQAKNGVSQEDIGPLMLAKIQIYILATAKLFSQFALRNPEDKK